ncbi:MAG: PTS sugar transporter subunit IIA [Spirochaetota bacterium]
MEQALKSLVASIKNSYVFLDIASTDKRATIHELISKAASQGLAVDPTATADEVFSNERSISSGLGYGVAFPHTDLENLKKEVLIFGTSKNGVAFDSVDKKPAHLIILFLTPRGADSRYVEHLSLFADLSHLTMYVVMILESRTEKEFKKRAIELLKKGGMRL